MKTKIIIAGVLVALIAGTTIKLFSNKKAVAENIYRQDEDKRILVQAEVATKARFDRSFTYTGTFAPYKEVMIVPQMRGEITGVYFNEGDLVNQGKPLVQIDDELLQAQYASAEANYHTAKKSLDRYESASQGGGVSQMQLDNLELSFKTAESQIKQLAKQIRMSRMEAPFAGTITMKDVELGSVINNTPVARITDLSQLKLEISVPEKEIGMFQEGEIVSVSTDVYPGKSFNGQIQFVADRADNAHNYTVKVLVKNNYSSAMLKAGMYGTATLSKGLNQYTISIPRSALLGSAKNPQVFVVNDSVAELKAIQTGLSNADSIEIISGLSAGEVIVTGGQINLSDGTKVEIAKK
jgi:RND family efflux transporter MFP subunit